MSDGVETHVLTSVKVHFPIDQPNLGLLKTVVRQIDDAANRKSNNSCLKSIQTVDCDDPDCNSDGSHKVFVFELQFLEDPVSV